MKFKPVQDVIVLRLVRDQKTTDSGLLHLPDVKLDDFDRGGDSGVVVAVGPGKRNKRGQRVPIAVEIGDRVTFHRFQGVPLQWEGDEYIFIREPDISGILETA